MQLSESKDNSIQGDNNVGMVFINKNTLMKPIAPL